MLEHALTVSLWPVLEAEGECDDGVVLEELCGEGVPPEVVALLRPLLQPLVHLVDAVVGLRANNVYQRDLSEVILGTWLKRSKQSTQNFSNNSFKYSLL